ncbi:hypothetical protein EVAR_29793_1 [Eumeta japonica]|uniref:Uncharacterized protein n=1 Tax=Eumeta variegata TaxID=151549 RepID=A0A4C1XSG5_EUMVA|nr:hypothetical protein EVAR_29793_1 [Eumeta japonica]
MPGHGCMADEPVFLYPMAPNNCLSSGGIWRGAVMMKENPTASTDVVFGRRRRRTFFTEIVSQIIATTFELVKLVTNSGK